MSPKKSCIKLNTRISVKHGLSNRQKGAYGREAATIGWRSTYFPSISCESGMTLHLNGYVCLFASMPQERTNSFSSAEPTVHNVSIASASPFLLMSMTLAPPYCWSNNSDPLSPHFLLTFSGTSPSRRFISFAFSEGSDLMSARGCNDRNPSPADDGHHHQTTTCTQTT